jgi:hypothetical protein
MSTEHPIILTVHHANPIPVIANKVFRHIIVGVGSAPAPYFYDIRSNVSERHSYAETRAIAYAALGTFMPATHIGIQHYRRTFFFPELAGDEFCDLVNEYLPQVSVPVNRFHAYNRYLETLGIVERTKITRWFNQYDAIVPPATSVASIEAQYIACHKAHDWTVFKECAAAYGVTIKPELTGLRACNCFVLRRSLFDIYAGLWQTIMDELWHLLPVENDGYQSRTIGFLSERLFTCWFEQQRSLAVRELPLLMPC